MTKTSDTGQRAYLLLKEISILSQLATAEFNRIMPEGLHVSHFTIVEHLAKQETGQTPQDLARIFQMSKQNMTNSIVQLRKRGLVKVDDNPNDGRSKIVTLTEAGHAFRDRAVTALEPMLSEVAAHDAFSMLETALPALQGLRAFMDERRSSTPSQSTAQDL